ncbi:TM2 domain-containing protein [Arthrobacter zhaoxinii]|uniref:TM2 domain-containing protein n=1 Tax=Arthrobacter zhaoxinii TaxID=2964616 RepID=UPI002104111C|nr:TM2 domain-containing protein [Arthrobacter zhaoxinii]MCQ2000587.1 NINE protein [Arthrobacter zhaoxinii]
MSGNGPGQGNNHGNRWSDDWDEQYASPKKPEATAPAADRQAQHSQPQNPQGYGQQAPHYPSPGYPNQPGEGYPNQAQGYPVQGYPNQAQGYGHAQFGHAPQGSGYRPQKSRVAAGLLGVFLGGFGVHRFYLGNNNLGIAQIIVTVVTSGLGGAWGFVEGLMILCNAKAFRADAHGVPLK